MIHKIVKRYTIKFSYAGIRQYADFRYNTNGELVNHDFRVRYSRGEDVPSIDGLTDINDILEKIKEVSFNNRAEIYLINGNPVNYHNNEKAKEDISNFAIKYEELIREEATKFFEKHIVPIIVKNDWKISHSSFYVPVLIEKDDEGEWDNVYQCEDEDDLEYLCYKFVSQFDELDVDLRAEHSNKVYAFDKFAKYLDDDYLKDTDLYIEL